MSLIDHHLLGVTRRHFLRQSHVGLGGLALAMMLGDRALASPAEPLANRPPRLPAKAKQVIFLHMAGGPSQLELFDNKPELVKRNGEPCPDEYFKGQRFAFIKGHPQLLGSPFQFAQHGKCGMSISSLLPNLAAIADDLTLVRSMSTEQFNHAPAQLLMHTGNQLLGHASLGAWATYGLGTLNRDLPGFMVLVSGGKSPDAGKKRVGQRLSARRVSRRAVPLLR